MIAAACRLRPNGPVQNLLAPDKTHMKLAFDDELTHISVASTHCHMGFVIFHHNKSKLAQHTHSTMYRTEICMEQKYVWNRNVYGTAYL